jgi:hypothetical protein
VGTCANRAGCDTVEKSLYLTDNTNQDMVMLSIASGGVIQFGKYGTAIMAAIFEVWGTVVKLYCDTDMLLHSNGNLK